MTDRARLSRVLVMTLWLAACRGSSPERHAPPAPTPSPASAAAAIAPAAVLPAAAVVPTPSALEAADTPNTAPESCGGLERIGLVATPIPLLGGRFAIRGLETTVDVALGGDEPTQEGDVGSTRLVYFTDTARLEIEAFETYHRVPAAFGDAARRAGPRMFRGLGPSPLVESLVAANVRVVAFRPGAPAPASPTVVVYAALVAHPDGFVEGIVFTVQAEQATSVPGCSALARRLLGTLVASEHPLAPTPTPFVAGYVTDEFRVELTLPAGTRVTKTLGMDFDMTTASEVTELGVPSAQLNVLFGNELSSSVPEDARVTERRGSAFGRDTTWREWTTAEDGREIHFAQTELEFLEEAGRSLQVTVTGDDVASVARLAAVVTSGVVAQVTEPAIAE